MNRSSLSPPRSESGVLLVGHGTRDSTGTDQFFELGRCLGQRLGQAQRPGQTQPSASVPVQACLLEFQEPTIRQGWQALVESGVKHIRVAPLLLFAAGHAKQDIPDELAKCQLDAPEISWHQSRPLSRHPAIVELATERLKSAIEKTFDGASIDSPTTIETMDRIGVLMVGRGSHDPCAGADMKCLSEVVRARLPGPHVQTGFYAMASPRVPESLDRMAESKRFETIIVHPHLLFAGRLYEAITRQVGEAARRHRNIRFEVSDYLGPDVRVADAIAARCGFAD